jgi:hypothetical protein
MAREGRTRGGDGEGRNRTGDTTVFSRVLYQLSYLAEETECSGAPDQPPQSQSRTRPAPEPGLARREAKRVRGRAAKKEGATWGNHGFPRD